MESSHGLIILLKKRLGYWEADLELDGMLLIIRLTSTVVSSFMDCSLFLKVASGRMQYLSTPYNMVKVRRDIDKANKQVTSIKILLGIYRNFGKYRPVAQFHWH